MDAILPGIGAPTLVKAAQPWETPGAPPRNSAPQNRKSAAPPAGVPPPAQVDQKKPSQPGVGRAIDIVA